MRLQIDAVIPIPPGVVLPLIKLDIAPAAQRKAPPAQWWPLLPIVVGMAVVVRPRRAR